MDDEEAAIRLTTALIARGLPLDASSTDGDAEEVVFRWTRVRRTASPRRWSSAGREFDGRRHRGALLTNHRFVWVSLQRDRYRMPGDCSLETKTRQYICLTRLSARRHQMCLLHSVRHQPSPIDAARLVRPARWLVRSRRHSVRSQHRRDGLQ